MTTKPGQLPEKIDGVTLYENKVKNRKTREKILKDAAPELMEALKRLVTMVGTNPVCGDVKWAREEAIKVILKAGEEI